MVYRDGKHMPAHRLAWEKENGPIPNGLFVLHRCDNRKCLRVSHLFLGTQADNMADMVAKGRSLTGLRNPKHTHPESVQRGEENGFHKLTAEQVAEVRGLYPMFSLNALARRFSVSKKLILNIVKGRAWKHTLAQMQAGAP